MAESGSNLQNHGFVAHDDGNSVLIETLIALGAEVRWSSCNIFSTRDDSGGDCRTRHSGFCLEGETEEEYWWCPEQTLKGQEVMDPTCC